MTAVVHKISVGAGSRAIEYTCHYGGEDNKERMQYALFSSVTAATESLGLSDNAFKTA